MPRLEIRSVPFAKLAGGGEEGGPRVSLVRVIGKRRVIVASLVRGVALCSPLMLMQPS